MINNINRDAYLYYAKQINLKELAFIKDFNEWLPNTIIDCHAHCNQQKHVEYIDNRAYGHMLSTFPSFDLEESKEWNKLLHPNKTIFTLRFPNVFRGINHKEANAYLLRQSPKSDKSAIYGLPDDKDYTIKALNYHGVSALKMYHSYPQPTAKEIYQYFPKEVLKVAEGKNIPIILHPPQPIANCLEQVLKLIHDFPTLNICLAHIGLTKFLSSSLEKALTSLAPYPTVMFDTALVSSTDVIEATMCIAGQDRLMYGSDAPLNLIRSVAYEHPRDGRRLVTKYPYHWMDKKDQETYGHLAVGATHGHWQSLKAIKEAISRLPQNYQNDAKKKIFYENAKKFYGF